MDRLRQERSSYGEGSLGPGESHGFLKFFLKNKTAKNNSSFSM